MALREDIRHAINCNSAENGSDTPDFILAEYIRGCLAAFNKAVKAREKWYGRQPNTSVRWTIETPCTTKGCPHVFPRVAVLYGRRAFARCPECHTYVDSPFEIAPPNARPDRPKSNQES